MDQYNISFSSPKSNFILAAILNQSMKIIKFNRNKHKIQRVVAPLTSHFELGSTLFLFVFKDIQS